jgi:excisionase family DNA binding protein
MAAADTIKPGWFSIEGAAIYTGFSVPAIRTAISAGTLPSYRVTVKAESRKPSVRIRREDLDRWIFGPTATDRQPDPSPFDELTRIRAEVEELCRAVVALRESLPPA